MIVICIFLVSIEPEYGLTFTIECEFTLYAEVLDGQSYSNTTYTFPDTPESYTCLELIAEID